MCQTAVACRIGAGAMFGQNDDAGYRSRDLRRAVCRAIIDDDYLQLFRRQALRPDSVETAANRGAAVPDSDDNAYQRVMYWRSEEHTSELQSLMRISYAVFC